MVRGKGRVVEVVVVKKVAFIVVDFVEACFATVQLSLQPGIFIFSKASLFHLSLSRYLFSLYSTGGGTTFLPTITPLRSPSPSPTSETGLSRPMTISRASVRAARIPTPKTIQGKLMMMMMKTTIR